MLTDEQVDQLEQAVCTSTLNDLPHLLTRLIPALFAELRLTRDAMRERTDAFLKAAVEVPAEHHDTAEAAREDRGVLHGGDEHIAMPIEVSELPEITGEVPADTGRAHKETPEASSGTANSRRKRKSRKANPGRLDPGNTVPPVGGQVREPADNSEL